MTTLLPLPDAAARLGVSQSALRRRLRNGTAAGERRPTASGFMWWVDIDAAPTPDTVRTPTATHTPTPERTPTGDRSEDGPPPPQMAIEAVRAAGMASYTRELLEPLHARLEAQAERIGRLELELEQSRARVAELELITVDTGAGRENAPPAESQAGRSWWQRLWS